MCDMSLNISVILSLATFYFEKSLWLFPKPSSFHKLELLYSLLTLNVGLAYVISKFQRASSAKLYSQLLSVKRNPQPDFWETKDQHKLYRHCTVFQYSPGTTELVNTAYWLAFKIQWWQNACVVIAKACAHLMLRSYLVQ